MNSLDFTYFEQKTLKLLRSIGSGYIGEVYDGEFKPIYSFSIPVIVKKLSSQSYEKGDKDSYLYSDIVDEITIACEFMNKTKHQIQFYGYSTSVSDSETSLYILMEQTVAMGDISKYIYQEEFWNRLTKHEYDTCNSNTTMYNDDSYWDYIMSDKDKLSLIYQICLAVQDLHSFNIVHCDLKPHNMLFVEDHVKLIDFNAAVKMNDKAKITGKREQGTPGYMSKEMYRGEISYKADIYSLGVTMLEIWFGDIWPTSSGRYDKCRRYVLDYLSLMKQDNPILHELVKSCVSVRPDKRPTLETITGNIQTMLN